MKHAGLSPYCLLILVTMLFLPGCATSKAAQSGDVIPHSNYGGCRIQGRHYHNRHVFIGDKYEPSLSEWLKY